MFSLSLFPSLGHVLLASIPSFDSGIQETAIRDDSVGLTLLLVISLYLLTLYPSYLWTTFASRSRYLSYTVALVPTMSQVKVVTTKIGLTSINNKNAFTLSNNILN